MPSLLHIVTQPDDELARTVIAQQRTLPDTRVEVADLHRAPVDYDGLLDRIFAADSVEVW